MIRAFIAEVFTKQYWLLKIINFQCFFHIFTLMHLKSLQRWIIYWMIMTFLWNKILKCTCLVDKRTPVPAYRLLSSPSNKQKAFNSSHGSSCIIRYNFIILTSKLQHEYLWFYISAKNGSVFKTIPKIHRTQIIRMELLI